MKKVAVAVIFALIFCFNAFAQTSTSTTPAASSGDTGHGAEASFGYARLTGDVGKNGWNGTLGFNFSDRWGVEGDLGGYYGKKSVQGFNFNNDVYTYTFGPKIMFPLSDERVTPWAHLLLGGGHTSQDSPLGSQSDSAFTWMLGGGADLNFNSSWAARGKIDFVRTNFFNNGDTHARLGVGIVYRFGR